MDLLRDVGRRERIRLALDALSKTEAPMDATRDEDQGDGGDARPAMFRADLGATLAARDVARHLPTGPDMPFDTPVPFHDRLGFFLADAVAHPPGGFPQPDADLVTLFPFADVAMADGGTFRVHARDSYYGNPAYSFVQAQAGAELWFGRVWLLFTCRFHGTVYNLALVSWLTQRSATPYRVQRPTFSWASRFTDCIEIEHLRSVANLVPSLLKPPRQPAAFHLLE